MLISGLPDAVSTVFNNLTGENFRRWPDPVEAHRDWLSRHEFEFGHVLPMLETVAVVDVDGEQITASHIGLALPRLDPVIGESYMVKVLPIDGKPDWRRMRLISHLEKSSETREIFHFMCNGLCYPVTREALNSRVMPLAVELLAA